MSLADRKAFYEEITMNAVGDTVEKLLAYPYGFHGDTGIRDFLYARLHVHGGKRLDFDDRDRRPGFSTILLQAEAYTRTEWKNTGENDKEARFDLALTRRPKSANAKKHRYAEQLAALFAFELGKNKALKSVIDRDMVKRRADDVTRTSDVSKLYRELRDKELSQGWAIEFYDSRARRGAPVIQETLNICETVNDIPSDKRLVVVFVEFSRDGGRHHVSSNDSIVEASLIGTLQDRGIDAGPELLSYSKAPASSDHGIGRDTWHPSASVEELFETRAAFAERLIRIGGMEASGRSSQYVNLSFGRKGNIAQLHPHKDGIVLVLRSRDVDRPSTTFAEIPVSELAGHRGANKSWLDGTGRTFERKGPAVAYILPAEVNALGSDANEWQEVKKLITHAKTCA